MTLHRTTDDFRTHSEQRHAKIDYGAARRAETQYAVILRRIAATIESIAKGFVHEAGIDVSALQLAFMRYADALEPWAYAVAQRMVSEVARRDEKIWSQISKDIGAHVGFMHTIQRTPIQPTMRQLVLAQAKLIHSLPLDAATKVEEWVLEAQTRGGRPEALVERIMDLGHVTRSRATLIARTETARASSILTEVRARSIYSEGYIWTSAHDRSVRPLHRRLDGTFHSWNEPPVADERTGTKAHAGCIYNCRCIPKVVIPEAMWTP